MSRSSIIHAFSTAVLFCIALMLVACEKKEETPRTRPPLHPDLEVGGIASEHIRIVWSQNQKRQSADPYSVGGNQLLMGYDSTDGAGARPLVKEKGNYSRPLLSGDGKTVIYTRKTMKDTGDGKRAPETRAFAMAFDDGQSIRDLGEGYAVDTWTDPKNGSEWVLAMREFVPTNRPVLEAKELFRIPLNGGADPVVLWDKGPLDPDNLQISADGTHLCAGAPWPYVSRVDLVSGTTTRLSEGCWPSLAPDGSGRLWAFAEDHRSVSVFDRENHVADTLDLAAATGDTHAVVFHPRWSNDARYIVFTGPYQDKDGRPVTIASGGLAAEVWLARLSTDGTRVERALRITQNDLGDNFPDAWVEK